jgi:CheY-like chemotaxis protein
VLADLWMPDMTGIELLTKVHALDPAAKRALLTGWGDLQVGDRLVRAAVLGQVDDWGLKPWQPGDEGFHQLVVGLLYEWAQLHRPGFQAVQVVGEQWSARAHDPDRAGDRAVRPHRSRAPHRLAPRYLRRDRWGFVVTGTDLLPDGQPPAGWPLDRPPMPLETSLPGVVAAGDVRHGSTKRVAGAVGQGSVAIRLVHEYLARR